MTEGPPPGIFPIFLRGITCEKYGFKTGGNVMDLVDHLLIKKEDILKEIQIMGVMSDFEPARKHIEGYCGEEILFIIDKDMKYGEVFLLCYTEEYKNNFQEEASAKKVVLEAKLEAERAAELKRKEEEFRRLNAVFEDKPSIAREWISSTTIETENEISLINIEPVRDVISIEVTRPARNVKGNYRFTDRSSDIGGITEFRTQKDPNFIYIKESDCGFQIAPCCTESSAQTTWFKPINKAVQYEAASFASEMLTDDAKSSLLGFLERIIVKVENALQQNESVDIFHETFRAGGEEEVSSGGVQTENDLRELKNFGDPVYSKSKAITAIDWMPKHSGLVAVSPVRNISFNQRVSVSGQTSSAFVLLWDFKQLVRPRMIMQSQYEIFCFRFNRIDPSIAVGGCITGQVVLWDLGDSIETISRRNRRTLSTAVSPGTVGQTNEEDESTISHILPKYVSNVDYSHKRCVADLFWFPPSTQVNFRGQLVGPEYLDGKSYQFVSVAADGMILVWDTRFEQIAADELRHIGRARHIPQEKANQREGGQVRALWSPIFRGHLKRLEGLGELSLCKVSYGGSSQSGMNSSLPGDPRLHLLIGTEEGDVLFTDMSSRRSDVREKEEDEEDAEGSRDYVRWMASDHSRPAVGFQQSPFFPDILLSVCDWYFNIWKVGNDKPLFTSPSHKQYLTMGVWSPTRAAVLFLACVDGTMLVWDFTDSSVRASTRLKVTTPARLTSMEFLPALSSTQNQPAGKQQQQLLAAGDDSGTVHIFEMPRNLARPVNEELALMKKFLEKEEQRLQYIQVAMISPDLTMSGEVDPDLTVIDTSANQEAKSFNIKKDDDDFDKLESSFLTYMNVT